jgi:phage virion morphogenesis protein
VTTTIDDATLKAALAGALAALSPAERAKMFRAVARDMAKANRARMTKQVGPDGERWAPRKRDRNGRVREAAKMMVGLRAARRLAAKGTAQGAEAGWTGRMGHLARVHHLGEADRVTRGGPVVTYDARPLLGWSVEDIAGVRDRVLARLAGGR